MTVKTREWGMGYHYGRLTAISVHATVDYGRRTGNLSWVVSSVSNINSERALKPVPIVPVGRTAPGIFEEYNLPLEVCWETVAALFASRFLAYILLYSC